MNAIRLLTLLVLSLVEAGNLFASPVSVVEVPSGPGAMAPFLFAGRDGLLLSWLEPMPDSKDVALRFARLRNGRWDPAVTIVKRNDLFVNWADFPSVVEDANGVLYAHWLQKSGLATYAYDVRISISSDRGRTWKQSFTLNRDGTKTEHGFVTLSPLSGGGVGATWLDGRKMIPGKEEGEMTLRYATIDAAGVIRGDVELDGRTCECCTTAMAISSSGPVIAYRDRSPDEVRDISVVRKTSNGWSKPQLLHNDGWKINGCPVNGPQVDARGNRVATAWFTGADDRGRAYVAFSDDGGSKFGKVARIDDGQPVGRLDLLLLHDETALVTWVEQTSAGAEIRARRVTRTGKLHPTVKIADSSTARAAGFPRTAQIGTDVYFAWTEQTATTKRIHIARSRF